MRGFSLLDVIFATALIVTLTGMSVPPVLSALDQSRTWAAAHYLSGRLNLARSEAVKRWTFVALKVEGPDAGYRYTFYRDGNGNGIRTADIAGRIDVPINLPERLDEKFPGVTFGILDGVTSIDDSTALVAGSDPVRFGQSDLVSFNPNGSATAGTFYIRGQRRQQLAVRVLGITGRVRIVRYDFQARKWLPQ
jgi:hypothetical protein